MRPWKRRWPGVFLGLVAFIGWQDPAVAQVNIEKLMSKKKQDGFSGSVRFDLEIRSGNVDIQEVGFANRIDHSGKAWDALFLLEGGIGWEGGDRFSNEGLVHLRQIYKANERLWPELFVQADYNKKRRLDFRGLVGGGLRLQLVQRDRMLLWWGSSYMLEHEEVDVQAGDPHPDKVTVHRWSNYISAKSQFNERVQGTWTGYLQPRLNRFEDIRILTEARLGVELSRDLTLETSFRLRYDNEPPQGIESVDYLLKNGLAFRF